MDISQQVHPRSLWGSRRKRLAGAGGVVPENKSVPFFPIGDIQDFEPREEGLVNLVNNVPFRLLRAHVAPL